MKIIVLAIDSDMVIARKTNDVEVLRVKAEAEALRKFNGKDLLDHVGGFLLEEFGLFVWLLPRCVGSSARSICSTRSLGVCRELWRVKQNVRSLRNVFLS